MFGENRASPRDRVIELLWRFSEQLHRRPGPSSLSTSNGSSVDRTENDRPPRDGIGNGGSRLGWSTSFDRATVPTYPYYENSSEPTRFRSREDVVNPVLTAHDVTDFGDAHFVADPFLIGGPDGVFHMFFEVFNRRRTPTAAIGHATSSDGGNTWLYDGIVLEEGDHLSFPYVFRYADEYYMIPDKWGREQTAPIDLYRADSFPAEWTHVARIVSPERPIHDFVAFRWRDRWWGIAGDGSDMAVFYTDELERDSWEPHPENPVVTDRRGGARPAGRPLVRPDHVELFVQDCTSQYGKQVRAFQIRRLSQSEYEDVEHEDSPVLKPSDERFGWNSGRMHHVDPWYTGEDWLCAVDGNVNFKLGVFGKYHWSIGVYTVGKTSSSDRNPSGT